MLARNATILTFSGITQEDLQAAVEIPSRKFAPCLSNETVSRGFVPPIDGKAEMFRLVDNSIFYIKMREDNKILPASVIKEETKLRVKKLEETGMTVGRREMKQLKEEVTFELLAKAFASTVHIGAWFDFKEGLLVVDNASDNRVDSIVKLITGATGGKLATARWRTNNQPEIALTTWIRTWEPPHPFTIDDKALLTNEEGGTVRLTNQSVIDDNIRELAMQGRNCTELAMTYDNKLSFVLTKKLAIKRISYLGIEEIQQDQAEMFEEERHDAEIILSANMIREAFVAISEAMGGLVEKESEAA